jgi:predicted DNA-binding protein (MmcQ/YjbR family)
VCDELCRIIGRLQRDKQRLHELVRIAEREILEAVAGEAADALALAAADDLIGVDAARLAGDDLIEIVNVRFSKGEALDFAGNVPGIYPAWHMNKKNWITIVLDDTLSDEQLFGLVNQSFVLSI